MPVEDDNMNKITAVILALCLGVLVATFLTISVSAAIITVDDDGPMGSLSNNLLKCTCSKYAAYLPGLLSSKFCFYHYIFI